MLINSKLLVFTKTRKEKKGKENLVHKQLHSHMYIFYLCWVDSFAVHSMYFVLHAGVLDLDIVVPSIFLPYIRGMEMDCGSSIWYFDVANSNESTKIVNNEKWHLLKLDVGLAYDILLSNEGTKVVNNEKMISLISYCPVLSSILFR